MEERATALDVVKDRLGWARTFFRALLAWWLPERSIFVKSMESIQGEENRWEEGREKETRLSRKVFCYRSQGHLDVCDAFINVEKGQWKGQWQRQSVVVDCD